jgi:hypothetical protein
MVTIGSSLLAGTSQEIALEAFIHAVPESGKRRELTGGAATYGQCTVTAFERP